jgi:hypothetical protein
METREILAIIFGVVALIGTASAAVNRFQLRRSIGAQHIRYIAVAVGLPMAGSLAFLGMLTEAAGSHRRNVGARVCLRWRCWKRKVGPKARIAPPM